MSFVGHDHIVINDKVKEDSREAITELKKLGVSKTVMLTGDNKSVAEKVAGDTGVDEFYAGLLPAQKVECVEKLLSDGCKLAFVGDGINDAPVLSRADVGIAMGALGSDAAIESIKIARKTMRIVCENIWFSLIIKALILILTAVGFTNMWIAVFGDVGVLIIATLNAMRAMIKVKK